MAGGIRSRHNLWLACASAPAERPDPPARCSSLLPAGNCLLARDGTCKLADVGLAKAMTQDKPYLTAVSNMGTFAWA